jgi:hypothetical protein
MKKKKVTLKAQLATTGRNIQVRQENLKIFKLILSLKPSRFLAGPCITSASGVLQS